ncbi:unnamed protein product [Urochloa humidicola]
MGIDPVTHLPLQEQEPAAATPPPPPPQDQEHHQPLSPPSPPPQQRQDHNQLQIDGYLPVVQPQEITTAPPTSAAAAGSNCGSASSASGGSAAASVVSPSCSSSASAPAAHGVEATEWPEPMYLFGMDGILDAAWDGLFPDTGAGGVDPFGGCYPGGGFDQDDGWM